MKPKNPDITVFRYPTCRTSRNVLARPPDQADGGRPGPKRVGG